MQTNHKVPEVRAISNKVDKNNGTILKLFLFTVEEYLKFYEYFVAQKKHSLLDAATPEDYIAIQTKLMVLRKYGSKGQNVFIPTVLNAAKNEYHDTAHKFNELLDNFEAIQQDEMETILSDGTGQNLYKTIEDVMYGLYLHADKHRIQNLIKIDPMLIFIATRKYVEQLEENVLQVYNVLKELGVDTIKTQEFEKAPVISVDNANNDIQGITGSPYWSNIYGKDASDKDTQEIIKENSLEDNLIILLCCSFIQELEKEHYSIKELERMVFPPTRKDWGDFKSLHQAVISAKDVGWSTKVRYNDKHDMAYVQLMQNVQGVFSIDHEHVINRDICVITLVNEEPYGWRIYKIGERADSYKETISIKEAIRRSIDTIKNNIKDKGISR